MDQENNQEPFRFHVHLHLVWFILKKNDRHESQVPCVISCQQFPNLLSENMRINLRIKWLRRKRFIKELNISAIIYYLIWAQLFSMIRRVRQLSVTFLINHFLIMELLNRTFKSLNIATTRSIMICKPWFCTKNNETLGFISFRRELSVMHSLRMCCKILSQNLLVHPKCKLGGSTKFHAFYVPPSPPHQMEISAQD